MDRGIVTPLEFATSGMLGGEFSILMKSLVALPTENNNGLPY